MPRAMIKRAVVAGVWLAAFPVAAQFSQYTQPGSLAQDSPEVTQESLRTAAEEARWRLGPLRVAPWIGLRDAGWYENPDGLAAGETDFSVTAGAGLRLYLPVGPKVFVAMHALPEYVWWQKATERRRVNGRYGLGVFGFFNRLTLDLEATRAEARSPLAPELPREVNHREDRVDLSAEVDLTHSLALFVGAAETDYSLLASADDPASAPLGGLDRTEQAARAGLRLHLGSRVTVGAGVERSRTDFPAGHLDRGSRGTSPLFEARYESHRWIASLDFVERTLTAQDGAAFADVDEPTGGLRFEVPGNRLHTTLYARRDLGLSLQADSVYFVGDLYGLGVTLDLGERSELLVFSELGRNDYVVHGPGIAARRDDLEAFGLQWSVELGRSLRMVVGGSKSRIDSNRPGSDRDLTSLRAGFVLGGGGPWG